MLNIKAKTINDAWKKSFVALYEDGSILKDEELYRDECVVIEIDNIEKDRYTDLFPMSKEVINEYNSFIIKGGTQGNVQDEHAIYHKRLFGEEVILNNQIKFIIDQLKKNPYSKRAQASLWAHDLDQTAGFTPCLQIIWVRVRNNELELHAHMRANDAYRKAIMNMNIFTSIQQYIANELGVKTGRYIHFADSYHFHDVDKTEIHQLYKKLKS